MLDCIAGGRVIAGFPVGSPMDTCFAYGQNPAMLRERYLEAHDIILKAWTDPATFAFNGRFNKLRYVNIWPRPVQKPHPPIWIPGGGSIETWRWCAEMDYVYSYLSYFSYKAGLRTMKGFWDAMDELGKDLNPYRAGFLQFAGVAETKEEAMRLYKRPAEYFYGRCLHVNPRFTGPPGHSSEATFRARIQSQVKMASNYDRVTGVATEIEDIVDQGYIILGSPDEMAEKLREVATEMNVGQLMTLCQFGDMDKELAMYNTSMFAERVKPQLSHLFDDEWENHWWPTPLPAAGRAELSSVAARAEAAE